jgi:hypothetical protein
MTLDELETVLGALSAHSIRADSSPTQEVLQRIEVLADRNPADRSLARAVHTVAKWTSAPRGLPLVVGGVRRERLVRWDDWTTTWLGSDASDGSEVLVRILRPAAAADPALRRQVAREARALSGLVEEITVFEGDLPGLRAPVPGAPMTQASDARSSIEIDLLHTRLLATALVSIAEWEESGLWLPSLTREELRNCGDRLSLVCLTPSDHGDHGALLRHIGTLLGHHDDTRLGALRQALIEAPPATAADATAYAIAAMAEHLAGQRHALFRRHEQTRHSDRHARLHALTLRLHTSVPPPKGVGAIGVDMDGEILIVHSTDAEVSWGPRSALKPVFSAEGGFVAPEARRLLRARASAPNSERLQADVHGDSRFTDAIGQWISAALRLRTVRLLLEKSA